MRADIKIKIEKGVPMPETTNGGKKSALRLAYEKMDCEDSFELPMDAYRLSYFYKLATEVGIKVSVRKVNAKTFRIWRVK